MAEAIHTTVSRRSMTAMFAALVPVAGATQCAQSAAGAASPDAALLALCERHTAAAAHEARCRAAWVAAPDGDQTADLAFTEASDDMEALSNAVDAITPRTMAGFVAKARVIAWVVNDMDHGDAYDTLDWDEKMTVRFLAELSGFGGAA